MRDTPRQDLLPALTAGLITASRGAGELFPQPRLAAGSSSVLMDDRHGYGFRLVSDGTLRLPRLEGVTNVDLGDEPETEGVAGGWLRAHGSRVALVRPDHYTYGTAHDEASLYSLVLSYRNALQ